MGGCCRIGEFIKWRLTKYTVSLEHRTVKTPEVSHLGAECNGTVESLEHCPVAERMACHVCRRAEDRAGKPKVVSRRR
jgi:hypothetical protein